MATLREVANINDIHLRIGNRACVYIAAIIDRLACKLWAVHGVSTMKKDLLYSFSFIVLMTSLLLSVVINKSKVEELSLIGVLMFSGSAVLISASLMSFTKEIATKTLYRIPLALFFALLSSCIYFIMFFFAFREMEGGESAMIFGGVFGVFGSLAVGLMAICINFLILSKRK